ncbi:class I SAM-dependent methyltransferase [Paraburkholderia sacchari]|uniref:Class I SAM-dependent methyltransferase n=2 Tax=Paraburkholderia sacchari TaxID=159450 RepID=A0A8T6Z3S4_9BURK|nr:class I SAM-dependent methyltransferase [Paraburkholderia sacchari]
MSAFESVLMRSFGRPSGILGWLGGKLMASMNKPCAAWVIGLLDIRAPDRVLEIGFGPGVGIQLLVETAMPAHVDGIDASQEMLKQAAARNAAAIGDGKVNLRLGPVESLPFDNDTFDKILTINSMQIWPDPEAALAEIRRVLKAGGTIALGFTIYSGQKPGGLVERLAAAGFSEERLVETDKAFCVLAVKPHQTLMRPC